jgi:hypothetical protein
VASLIVPALDEVPFPTLGGLICDFIEATWTFGPGPLQGQPAVISNEKRAIIYRAYEVFPQGTIDSQGSNIGGRRRFKRVGWSVRKGLAKTELLAWIALTELHPEAPIRCDGFDADGDPVGRPVLAPYIPMLAYSKEQVEELGYGAAMAIAGDSPDADLFDITKDRIARLDERGREAGKLVPLAGSPNARDGARTTFQAFDEPHRLYTPRLHEAHSTMSANLPKRPDADAWSLYVGTAGDLGQGSIQEDLHHEAEQIGQGKIKDPRIFYFHRDAGACHRGNEKGATGHDLSTKAGRIAAIREATGPDGEYGPGQFEDIAEQWTRPRADLGYLERVWLNLWVQGDRQAFDPQRVRQLVREGETIPHGSWVTAGFDGARFRDSTAIVITDIASGLQQVHAIWERPADLPEDEPWEVDPLEVDAAVDELFFNYDVFRWNGDPPHWLESHATWAGKYPQVEEWFTQRTRAMAFAIRNYQEAIRTGAVGYADLQTLAVGSKTDQETLGETLVRHISAAGRRPVNIFVDTGDEGEDENAEQTDKGRRLFVLEKLHETRKFDACMAAILSWEARLAALQEMAEHTKKTSGGGFGRIY